MAQAFDTEVLIVGAGPTGLMMALELARRGRKVRIIEQQAAPSVHSKALGIQARTLEVLKLTGLADKFLAAGNRANGARFYSGGKQIVHFALNSMQTPFPYVLILPQSQTETILIEALSEHGVVVERSATVTSVAADEDGAAATFATADGQEHTVRAAWLIGCDGAHSIVRHQLNFSFEGDAFPQGFCLADITMQSSMPSDELRVYAGTDRLHAIFPISATKRRLIGTTSPDHPEMTLEDWQARLSSEGPTDAVISDPEWLTSFKVSYRSTAQMRGDGNSRRVFLAGDASHIHSPAGGQGMNTGLQDAHNLAWKLALVIEGKADDALLETYNAERHPVAAAVIRATNALMRAATMEEGWERQVRDWLAPMIAHIEPVAAAAQRAISETAINYRSSPLSETNGLHLGIHAGDRAPDAAISTLDGAQSTLFDLFGQEDRHIALLIAPNTSHIDNTRLMQECRDAAAGHGKQLSSYVIGSTAALFPADVSGRESALVAVGDDLHNRYDGRHGALVLIRPDGYVGFRGALGDNGALQAYLQRWYRF